MYLYSQPLEGLLILLALRAEHIASGKRHCTSNILTQAQPDFRTARWWEHHDPYRRHEPLLYNTVLHDVGTRRLEVAPQHQTGSVTIPGTCPYDPLWFYDRPRKIVRQDLRRPAGEIKRTLDMMRLRFREWEGRAF